MWLRYVSARNRALRGSRLAVLDDKLALSFAELDERSEALACGLARLGVERGDRVALLARNRVEMVESYFALGKLGAAAVPVNHGLSVDEARHVVDSAHVGAALGEQSMIEALLGASAPELTVDFDDDRYSAMVESTKAQPLPDVAPDDIAAILFTSATTGRPKGVLIDQASFRASTLN